MSYNSSTVHTMESLEHVRSRTAVYVRAPDTVQCAFQVLKEILDNSVDESTVNNHCIIDIGIHFFIKDDRYQVLFQDNGRGVPAEVLERCFTVMNTSGKFSQNGAYVVSAGTNGMGSKATCGLSERFVAITKRNDGFGYLEVQRGVIKRSEVTKSPDKIKNTIGTVVFTEPDVSIITSAPKFMTDPAGFAAFVDLASFVSTYNDRIRVTITKTDKLVPDSFFKKSSLEIWQWMRNYIGTTIIFRGDNDHKVSPVQRYEDYVRHVYQLHDKTVFTLDPITQPINYDDPEDRFGCSIYLFLTSGIKHQNGPMLVDAVNLTQMKNTDSFHVSGLIAVIKEFLEPQIESKEVKEFFLEYYKFPICGSVIVQWKNAVYEGQTKDAFKDASFLRYYTSFLRKNLRTKPVGYWECIYEVIKEDVYEQYNRQMNKLLKTGKDLKNIGFSLNKIESYVGCRSSDNTRIEFLITEGNSAGGFVKQVRNPDTQAVYLLGGKPINAFDTDPKRLMKNEGFQDLIKLIGVSPADRTLENMKYHRIGILTDADYDGYHITALLLGNFYKINPLILSEGRVFVANPPLYSVAMRDKTLFMRDKRALDDAKVDRLYKQTLEFYIKKNDTGKVVKLTGDAYRDWCYIVKRIGTLIDMISNTLIVDPMYVEALSHCVDAIDPKQGVNTNKIRKVLGMDQVIYREEFNYLLLIKDQIEVTIPLERLATEIRAVLLPELEEIKWENITCYVSAIYNRTYTKIPMCFTQIFRWLQQLDTQFSVHRNKGLGEMDADDLHFTCVDPATRSFTTITSIGDFDRMVAMLGASPEERKKLVEISKVAASL